MCEEMSEGTWEYIVNLHADIGDEVLVEAKNRYEAEELAKELFLLNLTGEQAKELIDCALEAVEVERAI